MFPSSFNAARVNSWCRFSASTSNFMSCCIANLSCSSAFIIISCCDFSRVIRLSCSSLFLRFSPRFFLITTASSPCLFSAPFRFPFAGSGGDVSASLSGPVSKELQLADVLALGEGLDSVPLEMSLWIAVSETNLGFTLSLNPRKESMTSKNSNFSRPLPVALLLSLMLLYLSKRVFHFSFNWPKDFPVVML